MNKTLETKRLFLREFIMEDAEPFFHLNKNKEVIKYTGDNSFISIEEAKIFIQNYDAYEKSGFGRWAVVKKSSNAFIGFCGLKQHENYIDIGFRFFQEEWGNGYATESSKAVISYAFDVLGIDRLVGRVAQENLTSIRVLEKLGMTFYQDAECDGLEDAKYFEILRK